MPLPTTTKLSRLLLALLLAGATTAAIAQERPRRAPPQQQRRARSGRPNPRLRVAAVAGRRGQPAHRRHPAGKLAYTATAGTLSLFDQAGERSAAIFYTAYVANGAETANRPITFVFNGGPGAASAFLNLGAVGPRILEFGTSRDGAAARMQDNPDTWLAFTDLVLIDPVGAGWSRPAKPDGVGAFWGVQRRQSPAKTIALYIEERPLGLTTQIHSRRKLRRVSRRQGGARCSASGHLACRHRDGLADDRLVPVRRHPFSAHGAALHLPSLAASELERKGAFTPACPGRGPERFALTGISHHARRTDAARPRAPALLQARRRDQRPTRGGGRPVTRLHPRRLHQASARRRGQDRQPL
jgi:hypothetical protein